VVGVVVSGGTVVHTMSNSPTAHPSGTVHVGGVVVGGTVVDGVVLVVVLVLVVDVEVVVVVGGFFVASAPIGASHTTPATATAANRRFTTPSGRQ
jgi:hypothetical protein